MTAGSISAEEFPAALGSRIRTVRSGQGVTLRGLAGSIGVSPATMSAIENGRTRVSAVRLAQIASELGVGQESLLPHLAIEPEPPEERGGWREYADPRLEVRLQAALDAFLELGYHGATMRDIARRANLSVPAIYHRFDSKQEMLVAIMDLTMDDLVWRAEEAAQEGDDPLARLASLVECLVVYHTRRREWGFVGRSELRSVVGEARDRIRTKRIAVQRLVSDQVQQAMDQGLCRPGNAGGAARAIVLMCVGTSQWYTDDGPQTPEQIAEEYVAFTLGAIGAVQR